MCVAAGWTYGVAVEVRRAGGTGHRRGGEVSTRRLEGRRPPAVRDPHEAVAAISASGLRAAVAGRLGERATGLGGVEGGRTDNDCSPGA